MTTLKSRFDEAVALVQRGQLLPAEKALQKILRQRPNHVDAMKQLAAIAVQTGQTAAAVEQLDRALRFQPKDAETWYNRGVLLQMLKRPGDAAESYDKAIALKPDHAAALCNRGNALHDLGRPEEALDSYRRSIAIKPDLVEALVSAGALLRTLNRDAEALALLDRAIALRPDHADSHFNRGTVLTALGDHEGAIAAYKAALTAQAGQPKAIGNLMRLLLQAGQFDMGWALYERRSEIEPGVGARSLPRPRWTGDQDIGGKALFIYWEQGYGDTIQFCRYARLALDLGAKVVMEVRPALADLIRSLDSRLLVITPDQRPGAYDFHCPMMSLPHAFRTRLETIPNWPAYLHADEALAREWRNRTQGGGRRRIGIVWRGNREFRDDKTRSIDPRALLPLLDPADTWFALQPDPSDDDRAALAGLPHVAIPGAELASFSDTAALADGLDLVISVDTAAAHLAGALGKPVWILLPFEAEWRWLLNRTDSPWYPSARLFRQPAPGDWASVITAVRTALNQ